jgi:hypothetical protein
MMMITKLMMMMMRMRMRMRMRMMMMMMMMMMMLIIIMIMIMMIFWQMEAEGAVCLVCTLLDEVAWLLNLRGADVPNCPLPTSYAAVELHRDPATNA